MCLIQILYLIRLMCVLIWCTHLHRAPPHLMCSHQLQSRLLLRLFMGWSRRILCTQTYYRSLPWVAHWCDQVQMILMSVLGYGFPAIVWQPGGGLWLISGYPATLYRRSIPSWSTCPSIWWWYEQDCLGPAENLMQCRTNYNMKSRQWTWLTMTNYYIKSKQGTDPAGVVGCKWSKANGATADCQEESTKLQKKQTKDEAWLSAKHKAMQQNKYPSIKETKGKWWSQGCPSPCLVEPCTKSWDQLMNGSSS